LTADVAQNTCDVFFAQCSPEIYDAALNKLLDFIANEYAFNATAEVSV
jgi:hypothetical protein